MTGMRRGGPEPLVESHHTAAIAAAKGAVVELIAKREHTVAALLNLLPVPQSEKEAARLSRQLLANPHALDARRVAFFTRLGELRTRGVELVSAIDAWRRALRASSAHFSSLPDEELPFWHAGAAYPATILSDLWFVPAPVAADPFLLEWFGQHLPWMLHHNPKLAQQPARAVAMLGLTSEAAAAGTASGAAAGALTFAETGVVDDATPSGGDGEGRRAARAAYKREHERLAAVQRTILAQAKCTGLVLHSSTPAQLLRDATRRSRGSPLIGERWRWMAMQAVLYGEPLYVTLLKGLPAALQGLAEIRAAKTVQRLWRSRRLLQFTRVIKAASAVEVEAPARPAGLRNARRAPPPPPLPPSRALPPAAMPVAMPAARPQQRGS